MSQPLMPLEEVLKILEDNARPVREQEDIPLARASGRILAQDIVSPFDVPAFDNSRMDGYAVRATECSAPLPISQVITAGMKAAPLAKGTAARIFTGAMLPDGADSVVMQENTQSDGKTVTFTKEVRANSFIGKIGEDLAMGQTVLKTGQRLRPQDVGLAASMGIETRAVFRKPRIALFSTGDELAEPGKPLAPGQIYNSNHHMLAALLERTGCELLDFGLVPDDLQQTQERLEKAAVDADMVLTSGGVSVGEKDYLRAALDTTGELTLWRICIKPGKPLVFGHLDNGKSTPTPYMGLPGNPVSAFVTWLILARPFLLKLAGASDILPRSFRVVAGFDQPEPQTRRQFLRCRLEMRDGQTVAVPFANQSSAVLLSTSRSDGLAVVYENDSVTAGDLIDFYPYQGLLG